MESFQWDRSQFAQGQTHCSLYMSSSAVGFKLKHERQFRKYEYSANICIEEIICVVGTHVSEQIFWFLRTCCSVCNIYICWYNRDGNIAMCIPKRLESRDYLISSQNEWITRAHDSHILWANVFCWPTCSKKSNWTMLSCTLFLYFLIYKSF